MDNVFGHMYTEKYALETLPVRSVVVWAVTSTVHARFFVRINLARCSSARFIYEAWLLLRWAPCGESYNPPESDRKILVATALRHMGRKHCL